MVIRTSHLVLAVVLHVLVLGLLLIGFHCSRKVTPPPIIQAQIVGQPAKPLPPKPDTSKQEEEQRRRQQEAEQRKLEEQKKAQQEEARRKQEQLEAQRKQEQLQAQRKAEEQAKLQAQQEARQKAAEEAHRKDEAARKAKEEQARRDAEKRKQEQKQAEEQLRQQMAAEQNQREAAARASATQLWVQQITDKVTRNWLRPPGTSTDFQCKVQVQLLPGGQVVGVKMLESCGSAILDDSVQRAIYKSDPLPTPDDPAVFQRDLTFTFVPKS